MIFYIEFSKEEKKHSFGGVEIDNVWEFIGFAWQNQYNGYEANNLAGGQGFVVKKDTGHKRQSHSSQHGKHGIEGKVNLTQGFQATESKADTVQSIQKSYQKSKRSKTELKAIHRKQEN